MHQSDPSFPPLLTARAIKRPADPLPEAVAAAQRGDMGAGDLLWSRRTDRAELAIVLEPEVALARSAQMIALAMVALGEALGQLLPPQVAVEYRWPGEILVNGGCAGRVVLVAPGSDPSVVPDWLVVALGLQLTHLDTASEPGFAAHATSLFEEGGGDVTRTAVLEAFGAYFMSGMHGWSNDGFRGLHDQWLFRAAGRTGPVTFPSATGPVAGLVLGLDEEAGLIIKPHDRKALVLPYLPFVLMPEQVAAGSRA